MNGGNFVKVFKCNKCSNIVAMIEGNEQLLKCCGESLNEILVRNGDGEVKHKPVMQVEDNQVYIKVGEEQHPMDEEHYIKWILVVGTSYSKLLKFNPGELPECVVPYENGLQAFAYCNKHSLWKNEL